LTKKPNKIYLADILGIGLRAGSLSAILPISIMKNIKFALLILLALPSLLLAQKGTLTGKVFDQSNSEGLIGAAVQVKGTQIGAMTDLDGNFRLELAPGTYTIVCSYVSFTKKEITDITVKAGETINQYFAMTTEVSGLDEVVISARKVSNSETAILSMQKKAPSVINAISSQEISKNGDSQAASALKRVSGISIEGDKYVYVRGLSDRYSLTTLNGAEIPGLDPNRNTVQMDLFPSNIINNIVVHKTFSPELPASFSGGYINIETKDFPNQFSLGFSTSLDFNSRSNLNKNFLTYEGGSTDFLAIEDGSRSFPVDVASIPNLYENNNQLDDITRSFNKNMEVETKTSTFNHGHGFSIGNQIEIGERVIGYNGSLSYQRNFTGYDDGVLGRYKLTGMDNEDLNKERLLNVSRGKEEILIGGLISVNLKLNPNNTIGIVGIHNRSGAKMASFLDGERPTDEIGSFQQTRELSYVQRAISSVQLKGSHYLEKFSKLRLEWMSTLTNATQQSPDLRYLTNSYFIEDADTLFLIEKSKYSLPARFSREMNEFNIDNKVDFELPVTILGSDAKVKFGFANIYKSRKFEEQRVDINSQNNSYSGSVEDYFSDDNIGQTAEGTYGIYVQNASELRNNYTGEQNVFATYALTYFNLNEFIKVQAGARLEMANIFIESYDTEIPTGSLDNIDVLPSLNLTYKLDDNMNLRGAVTRTLARPTFRELAPYASYDYATGETKIGNENLVRTLVDNIDIRWERFQNGGEVLSIGAFYKKFRNPIETTFNPIAANPELTWQNIDNSNLYGLEFELRQNLDFTPTLRNFKIGTNVTIVKSEVTIQTAELEAIQATDPKTKNTRVMFGQSPIVVNGQLSYDSEKLGLSSNLSYNMAGKKLAVVVVSGTPNIFEQEFHSLNLSVTKNLGDKFSMRLSAKNLLDSSISRTYTYNNKEYFYSQFRPGITYGMSLSYNLN
jgi:outer membrane receptor for ferrienterochelin and colicin